MNQDNAIIKEIVLKEREALVKAIEDATKKIAEIDKFLDNKFDGIKYDLSNGINSNQKVIPNFDAKTNKITWPDYILSALTFVNKKIKAKELSGLLIEVNPNLDEELIHHQVRHHLSKLGTQGKIKAEKAGASVKDGNYYYI